MTIFDMFLHVYTYLLPISNHVFHCRAGGWEENKTHLITNRLKLKHLNWH